MKSENVLALGQSKGHGNVIVSDFDFWADIKTESTPSHLVVSYDGLTLVVVIEKDNIPVAEAYDVRGFTVKVKKSEKDRR